MLPLGLLLVLLQAPPSADQPAPTPPRWASAGDLELIADERDSLRGVTRLALDLQLPDPIAESVNLEALKSTIVFRLEQAGVVVTPERAIEDPLLAIVIRIIDDGGGRGGAGQVLYRVYADVLQLVRLADRGSSARLMMASTWHAGSFGAVETADGETRRPRIAEVVDVFLDDLQRVNPPPPAPTAP